MASYRNIVLIALFFLIATTPRTYGVLIGDVVQVNVLGRLSCVHSGALPIFSGAPLGGVAMNITCNGSTTTLGQAITNTAGILDAVFNIGETVVLDISTCMATANFSSIESCNLFPPTGILRMSLVLVSIVQQVAQLVTGPIFF